MTDKEALKMALDALELVNIEFVCNGAHHAKKDRHGLDEDCPVTMRYQKAITALKERLAQPEQEPVFTYEQVKAHIQVAMMSTTTPPQRTWVDLPDEEIKILWIQYRAALPRYLCFAKALLARAKEENT